MTLNLAQKLQELKQLVDNGLLTPAEYERERETLLAAWRASSVPAVSVDLDALPTVIALPLREYLDEVNPVLKLWYACDGVEMLLRLVVMMGLGVLSQRGPLTPELRKRLQEYRLEEPTLGNWRALAEAVVEALGDAPDPLPELPGLVRDTLAPLVLGSSESERDESNSFIRLRNRLAHGGGISRALAQRLGEIWQPRLRALWEQLAWLATVELVAQDGQGGYGVLRGPNPQARPYTPPDPAALAQAFAAGDAVLLARGEALLPLWPLALYGPPRSPNPDTPPADEIVPQVYLRRGEVRLQYTPLGALAAGLSESEASALERFLDWFKVADEPRARRGRFQVHDFTDEMRKDGLRLIGRKNECDALEDTVKERTEGVVWVSGKAGIGKSYLFAWLTLRLLDEPPPDTLVLPYRFRAGDERCSREAFLRFAVERLAAWLNVEVEADSTPWLKRLRGLLEQLAGRRVVFLLDGLDEIAARDARFAQEAPLALTGPEILWVCAGRPEYDLPAVFAAAGAFQPFSSPDGLPGMDEGDIRTLLLERIGPLRKHLLRHDQEQGERIGNPFVEKVARAAAGVPLYVKYVIDDIFAGRYRVLDGHERLPPSLSAYYEELLRRLSVGDLHQVLTPLAATLAVALEPLDAPALAALLYRRGKLVPEGEAGLQLVERGLSAIASMLKRAPTLAGRDGYTLYHLSLRQHMATSEHSRVAVATAREVLGDLALDVTPDAAAPYLYRAGVRHLIGGQRISDAAALLASFDYLMERLQHLADEGPRAVLDLLQDWATINRSMAECGTDLVDGQIQAQRFFHKRQHLLRECSAVWSADRILLQVALDEPQESEIARAAECYLSEGKVIYGIIRCNERGLLDAIDSSECLFIGHTGVILGALELSDGRLLSWSSDGTLRLWRRDGRPCGVLEGHSDTVYGAIELSGGQLLSWSSDSTLRLWDKDGRPYSVLQDDTNPVYGALPLGSGGWLSWSEDKTLRLWDRNGQAVGVLKGHKSRVNGALMLPDKRLLSWSDDKTLRFWTQDGHPCGVLKGHKGRVLGVLVLSDGRLLSWSDEETIRLWDKNGRSGGILRGHEGIVCAAIALPDGEAILIANNYSKLYLWKGQDRAQLLLDEGPIFGLAALSDGQFISWDASNDLSLWSRDYLLFSVFKGHRAPVSWTLVLSDSKLLSGSFCSGDMRLWDMNNATRRVHECSHVLVRHNEPVSEILLLPDNRILSWSDDQLLQLWDGSGWPIVLRGHTGVILGALVLSNCKLVSWGLVHQHSSYSIEKRTLGPLNTTTDKGELRLWDKDGRSNHLLKDYTIVTTGALALVDNRILSWTYNEGDLRLWDDNGSLLRVLQGHTSPVLGACELSDGRLLTWSVDCTLRLWSIDGSPLKILTGHSSVVFGALEFPDGQRLLSWSQDGNLFLWDKDGHILRILEGHTGPAVGAMILRNNQLISWSNDSTLRLWDLNGMPPHIFQGHEGRILGVVALDDDYFLSWSNDNTIRLWNTDGQLCAVRSGHSNWGPQVVALSGNRVLIWFDDGILQVWKIHHEIMNLFSEYHFGSGIATCSKISEACFVVGLQSGHVAVFSTIESREAQEYFRDQELIRSRPDFSIWSDAAKQARSFQRPEKSVSVFLDAIEAKRNDEYIGLDNHTDMSIGNTGIIINAIGRVCIVYEKPFLKTPFWVAYHLDRRQIEVCFDDNLSSYQIDWRASWYWHAHLARLEKILIIRMENKKPIEGFDLAVLQLRNGKVERRLVTLGKDKAK